MEIADKCVKYVQSWQKRQRRSGVFVVKFKQISYIILIFP